MNIKTKMKNILIVPYEGESAELTKVLKRYGNITNVPRKKECEKGSCPLPKPFGIMSAEKIKNSIENTIKSCCNVKQIDIMALNEKDQLIFVDMSRAGDWGKMGVTVKIIKV